MLIVVGPARREKQDVRVDDHDLKTCQLHAIMEWDETEMAATKPGLAEPLERVCQRTLASGRAPAWRARLKGAAVSSRSRLVIVKLGGSHATGPISRTGLTAIAAEAGSIAIVPGGGPFADAVRTAQASIGYDDRAAHVMALMAMAQFGCALPEPQPRLDAGRVAFRDPACA